MHLCFMSSTFLLFIKNGHLRALIKWDVPKINAHSANSPRISSIRVKTRNFFEVLTVFFFCLPILAGNDVLQRGDLWTCFDHYERRHTG